MKISQELVDMITTYNRTIGRATEQLTAIQDYLQHRYGVNIKSSYFSPEGSCSVYNAYKKINIDKVDKIVSFIEDYTYANGEIPDPSVIVDNIK